MRKIDIKRRLNNMVDYYRAYSGACDELCKDGMFVLGPYSIHVDRGIQYLAASVDETLTLYPRDGENFQYEHSFTYKGVRLFQLGNTEELPEVVWDD